MFRRKAKPIAITEEGGFHQLWYDEARKMTADKLPEFIKRLSTAFEHDYGTIVHAIAASALAAAYSVNRTPQGGITGFQASCVMWQFIQEWMTEYKDTPARILKTVDMLYPQYEEKFTTISQSEWQFLQDKANQLLLAEPSAHLDVLRHWQEIASGKVPFGFKVKE